MNTKIKYENSKCKGCGTFKIYFNGSTGLEYVEHDIHGISHLLEHCMCEKVKEIETEIKTNGLNWNAWTSDTQICFFISGLLNSVHKVANKFMNAVLNYEITKDVFEREKKIVLTEYNMDYSDQFSAFYNNFERRHYNYCGAIGLKTDIENITYERFMEYKHKYYDKPSFIGIVQPTSKGEIKNLEKVDCNDIEYVNGESKFGKYNDFPMEHYATYDSQRIILMNCEIPLDEDCMNFTNLNVLKNVLNNGLTSVLYQEIREKLGYVYSIHSSISDYEDKLKFKIFISCESDKCNIVKSKLIETITNISKFITKKRFNIEYKTMKNLIKLSDCISYDNNFNKRKTKNKENIISNKLNYEDFLKFVDLFNNAEKFYCQDNEF